MQIMLRWVVDYTNLLKDLKLGFTILLMVNLDTLNSLANLQTNIYPFSEQKDILFDYDLVLLYAIHYELIYQIYDICSIKYLIYLYNNLLNLVYYLFSFIRSFLKINPSLPFNFSYTELGNNTSLDHLKKNFDGFFS